MTRTAIFWGRVARGAPHVCWEWQAGKTDRGYGLFRWDGRNQRTHRIAFFLTHGRWPEPEGCHTCDNPSCCNPAHIFEGTQADNMQDKQQKGRAVGARGSQSGKAKLTEWAVCAIMARWLQGTPKKQIAREFNVSDFCIRSIISGRTWSHLWETD